MGFYFAFLCVCVTAEGATSSQIKPQQTKMTANEFLRPPERHKPLCSQPFNHGTVLVIKKDDVLSAVCRVQ